MTTPAPIEPAPSAQSRPQGPLSVVIIARNEAEHIAACIEAVLTAVRGLGPCEIVLVDSCSQDDTVQIAGAYPIRIIELSGTPRCCAALGRCVGTQVTTGAHVMFVDGDSTVHPDWLVTALRVMAAHPEVGAVGGREAQVYYANGRVVGEKADYFDTGSAPRYVDQLGGNGLYRRAALEQAGSFNPYIWSFEEAELGARLRRAGWRLLRVPDAMAQHHTPPPDALPEYWRRFRSHLLTGQGQVLRVSLRQGLFWEHARRLNRVLLFSVWLGTGMAILVAGLLQRAWIPGAIWVGISVAFVVMFMVRSRSVTKPFRLMLDWTICSVPFVWGFLLTPADPRRFCLDDAVRAEVRPQMVKVPH